MNRRRGQKSALFRIIERLEERILLAGDDTLATATALLLAANTQTQQSDSIDPAGDRDIYKVTLAFGDTLTADIDAETLGALDSYLRIFDATGTEIVHNDDDGSGVDSFLSYTALTSGVYYIGVSGFGTNPDYDPTVADSGAAGNNTGNYTLKLLRTPLADAGDTRSTASNIPLAINNPTATQVPLQINAVGDVDIFQVTLNGGDVLTARMNGANGTVSNGLVRVFDSSGSELTPNQDGRYVATSSGAFYVGASDINNPTYDPGIAGSGEGGATGDYVLELSARRPSLADGNGTLSTSTAVYFLRDLGSTLLPKSPEEKFAIDDADVDMYSVTLVAGDHLRVLVDAQAISSTLDARLRLFDAAGHELATNDNALGLDPELLFTANTSGTYYFGVSGAANATYDPISSAGLVAASVGEYRLDTKVTSADFVTAEVEPNNSAAAPNVIQIIGSSSITGSIGPAGDVDVYMFTTAGGRFTSQVVADPGSQLDARLTLLGADGRVWQTSDDQAIGNVNPLVSQQLEPGTYFLKVDASRSGANTAGALGAYHLNSTLGSGDSSFGPHETSNGVGGTTGTGINPVAIASGDFNGDGISDFVTTNNNISGGSLSILLGKGDLSFEPVSLVTSGVKPVGVVTGEFTGNHQLDLAVVDQGTVGMTGTTPLPPTISIFQWSATGGFTRSNTITIAGLPTAMVTADFNHDGSADLAFTNALDGNVTLLLGHSNGTFTSGGTFAVGQQPKALVVGDFNGDQSPDLAVANQQSKDVSILLNNNSGGFAAQSRFGVGDQPTSITVANFNGDAFSDLAVANAGSGDVSILYGTGNGKFAAELRRNITGASSLLIGGGTLRNTDFVAAADFNADGLADLLVGDSQNARVAVALGTGVQNDPFQPARQFSNDTADVYAGGLLSEPTAGTIGDFNNDGRLDFATADGFGNHVSVYGGLGDGRFLSTGGLQTGKETRALVVAAGNNDLNDDGHADLIAANADGASVFLGEAAGSFQTQLLAAAGHPNALAVGDFNNDGRPDLTVANYFADVDTGVTTNQVFVLLGRGDGTYYAQSAPVNIGNFLSSIVATDFNGDGNLDLAVTSQFEGTVIVLLGNGNAGFSPPTALPVGAQPDAVATGDFNHDGKTDLAVANQGSNDISILLGLGSGTFAPQSRITAGLQPRALAVGDFNGDGADDLAVDCFGNNRVTVLAGLSVSSGNLSTDGQALRNANISPLNLAVGDGPRAIVAGNFNGDFDANGRPRIDLAVATGDQYSSSVSVLLNLGGGRFTVQQTMPISSTLDPAAAPRAIVAGDFNDDGVADLAVANETSRNVSILIGLGDGSFKKPGAVAAVSSNAAPLLGDFNGDGTADTVALDQAGNVLLRLGRPGEPGNFDPPRLVNAGKPASSIAAFKDGNQVLLGVLDRGGTPVTDANGVTTVRYFITLYRISASGVPSVVAQIDLRDQNNLPEHFDRIVAANLNGDNRDDLIAVDSARGALAMFLRSGTGFDQGSAIRMPIGNGASDLLAANLDNTGGIDALVTNLADGTVSIFTDGFATASGVGAYRTNSGPTGVDVSGDDGSPSTPLSFDAAASVAVGDFNEDLLPDVVVANAGSNTLGLLLGKGNGGFVNATNILAGSLPTAVRVADFNGDKHDDLAVLNAGTHDISIFLGDGHGHFSLKGSFDAGNSPVGLTVFDATGDGKLDLLVGNEVGDVTILRSNGDGTFQPFTRIDKNMAISVGDLDGDGTNEWVIANNSSDRVVVQHASSTPVFDRNTGVAAPAGVKLADLNGDQLLDMIVANSGGNSVLVYLGQGGGQFGAAQSFYAGTDPVDVQVSDINADGHIDVIVSNYGSNDVSILLGTGSAIDSRGLLIPGPLLRNLPRGVISTQIGNFQGGQTPDLLVTSRDANMVTMLTGTGDGSFRNPTLFSTGSSPTQTLIGNFDRRPGLDFVTLNFNSNSLTYYSGFDSAFRRDLSSGGSHPVTAITADFNNDGALDLVVGNNGNGVFAVFDGGQAGLSLMNTFSDPALDHPAALALAEFGQGKELQLLALGEGDELVHEFGRDSVIGETPAATRSLLVGLTNLGTSTLSALFGNTSSGFSALASIAAALGLSAEGFFTQTSTASAYEGSGADLNRPFPLEIIDNIGAVISTGKLWFESTLQQFSSSIGLNADDSAITQTVEDVVALLFPHLPVHALPSLIHNILSKASAKPSATPLATDQAMENYDVDAWIASADSEFEDPKLSLTGLETAASDASLSGVTDDKFTVDWVATRGAELADQLAGMLAAGGGKSHRSEAVEWNTSPEKRAVALRAPAVRGAAIPHVVTVYDGTKRFGKPVPKLLVPPAGAAPNRPVATSAKPNLKSAHSGHSARQTAIAAAAAIGSLGIAGYVNHGRRREKTTGSSYV